MSDPREPRTDAEREKAIGGGAKPNHEDDGMRTWTCGCYEDQSGYHFCGKNHTTPDPAVSPVVARSLSVDELWQWIEDAAYSEDPSSLEAFRQRVAQLKAALVPRPEPREPESSQEELIAQRCLGHGEGQQHAIEDVLRIIEDYQADTYPLGTSHREQREVAAIQGTLRALNARIRELFNPAAVRPASAPSLEPQSLPQKWREHAQWLRRSGNTFTAARIEDCASDLENAAVRPASAPSLEQERLGPPFNCHHEFNITAWHRHERVGTHCHKCGAFRPKEFEVAASGR